MEGSVAEKAQINGAVGTTAQERAFAPILQLWGIRCLEHLWRKAIGAKGHHGTTAAPSTRVVLDIFLLFAVRQLPALDLRWNCCVAR